MTGGNFLSGLMTALLLAAATGAPAQPALGVLKVSVAVTGRDQQATPIHRHALLISDNPSTAPPRRVLTQADGTFELRLPPGNYTIESDQPLAFEGRLFQWTQMVDVVAGRDAVVLLTAANADAEVSDAANTAARDDPEAYARRWLGGVAGLWTATTHASAALVDTNGLLVTSQRVIGDATAVEVQLTPAIKVAGIVLAADAARDVAVLRIDPATASLVKPVPLACESPAGPSLHVGQAIVALEVPLRRARGAATGTITRISGTGIESSLVPESGGAGGPVFSTTGAALGIVSIGDEEGRGGHAPVVPLSDVCAVLASVRGKLPSATPPATRLPVEPTKEFPAKALNAAQSHSTAPSQIASGDFDITFLTPQQVMVARNRGVKDFGNWSEYVGDVLPVVMVRATPKLVEGFWAKVARGAIMTQGVALPAFKRPKSGFHRMRAFCGAAEVTPIHPLKIEYRLSASERMFEGLYVFPHDAFPPACGSVRLELFSEKEPGKADARAVDASIVQQIWTDLAPFRDLK